MFDLKMMDSSSLYENLCSLPVVSMPDTPLLQDKVQECSPKQQRLQLEMPQKVQLLLDFIVKFHSYHQFVDHHNIWELADDTFLIVIGDTHSYLVKCTVQQAIVLSNKQIPVMTILTGNIAEQNKAIFRLGQLIQLALESEC